MTGLLDGSPATADGRAAEPGDASAESAGTAAGAGGVAGAGAGARTSNRWHYRRSLASRVTILTTLVVAFTVALIAGGAYVSLRTQLIAQLDQSLFDRADAIASSKLLAQVATVNDNIPSRALGASDISIAFLSQSGVDAATTIRPLDSNAPIRIGRPELEVANGTTDKSIRTVVSDGQQYRVVAVPYNPGVAVVVAKPLDEQRDVLDRLGIVVLVLGLVGVVLAALAGWAVARNGLRPVRRLTASAEEIARTEDLTTPIPVEGNDEVGRLAGAFNGMLASLHASRERQRRLVTDAGHELRTPLTSLRTNVDLLTQSDDSGRDLAPEARTEMLTDIREQIDELTTLIGDLTELARDEPLAPVVGTVDLSEIVDVSVARVRRRGAGITLDVMTEPWEVIGESAALERAITNLLDNAVKWSPPDGTVTVRLHDGLLTVDDQGPGIAPADRERVFDRFWRATESRTMPGSGLGLSIVRQVAERHSGSVSAHAAPGGGARLQLYLPGGGA